MTHHEMVAHFHQVFGQIDPASPTYISIMTALFRNGLLSDEVKELEEATMYKGLDQIAKEIADVLFVAYGTAAKYGIDMDRVFPLVYESNMSKLGLDGKPILRADGKILKGPNYHEPDLSWLLNPIPNIRNSLDINNTGGHNP